MDIKNKISEQEELLKKSLEQHGDNHPEVADICTELGYLYDELDLDKALEYHEKALRTRLKLYGEDHIDVASGYNDISLIYTYKKNHEKALDFGKKALDLCLKINGEKHEDTLVLYSNLARLHLDVDDFKKAVEIQDKMFKEFDESCLEYSARMNIYITAGDVYKKYELFRRDDHPNETEYYEKAVSFFIKAMEAGLKIYDENDVNIAAIYNKIASCCRSIGKHDESLEYALKALRIRKDICEKSPEDELLNIHLIRNYEQVAFSYVLLNDYENALINGQHAIDLSSKVPPEYAKSHFSISYLYLSKIYEAMGNDQKASEFEKKASEMHEKISN